MNHRRLMGAFCAPAWVLVAALLAGTGSRSGAALSRVAGGRVYYLDGGGAALVRQAQAMTTAVRSNRRISGSIESPGGQRGAARRNWSKHKKGRTPHAQMYHRRRRPRG